MPLSYPTSNLAILATLYAIQKHPLKNIATLKLGQEAIVRELLETPLSLKLLEMGFMPGTKIKLLRKAPMGTPLYLKVNGHYMALRNEEAEAVIVEEAPT